MTELIWLDLVPRHGATQMAIDTVSVDIAREEGCSILRLYRWQGNTVSFGANESALRHWRRDLLEADGIHCVRRPTGGRGVWHDTDDLTYSWVGRSGDSEGVRRIYRELHQRLATAIDPLGGPASLSDSRLVPGLAPGACFDAPIGGEVLVGGRKAIGSAQRVIGDHLLQHGAMAIRDRSDQLSVYRRRHSGAQAIGGGELPGATETAQAIAGAWRQAGALELPAALAARIVLASDHVSARYRDPDWTWRR
ncbi:MAG TPA: hypothetical protein PLL69_02520 [Gemmatimonadales bacterium]|nr:hypothetical protein [Gemmatimonadales bacterium]